MIRILAADDEPVARQVIRELLEEIPGVELVGEAASGPEAVNLARKLSPDVLLLDLQMPGMTGFQVSQSFERDHSPLVIFVTAFHEHALEAFNAGALDYLLKPVRRERLEAALEKARTQLAGKGSRAGASSHTPHPPVKKIVGKIGNDLHLLDPCEVIAFQAEGDLVFVITDKLKYYCDHTLKALETRLPREHFRRVHRSTIINTDRIRKVSPLSSKRWLLRMSNGLEVIVSKRLSGLIRSETGW